MNRIALFALLCSFTLLSTGQTKFINSVHADFFGNQIDGDGYGGYNHIGFQFGIGTKYLLNEGRNAIGFEMNFARKGARVWPDVDRGLTEDFVWNLNYVEVPIFYVFNKWGIPFEVGPTISYLLSARRDFNGIQAPPPFPYREIELGGMLGFNYKLTEKLYFKFRVTNSISPILKVDIAGRNNWAGGSWHRAAGLNLTYYFTKSTEQQ